MESKTKNLADTSEEKENPKRNYRNFIIKSNKKLTNG
jgi:hypothetical protein